MVAILVVVLVIVLLPGAGDDGPGEQFETATKAFHDAYDPAVDRLSSDLNRSSGGIGDPARTSAVIEVNKLTDAFVAYEKAVKAIDYPDSAKTAVADLTKTITAGKTTFVNVGASFTASQMKSLVDQFQPLIERTLTDREKAVRKALGVA